ncbi:MAG: RluA family pseudouridine synthase [Spirochaetes bacterium]|nr:MAG: RluA family pseudouridine synthase [Spirochaetota bacterium]
MEPGTPEVLFEDNHLIAVLKPAGTLVQGDSSGRAHLMDMVKSYLKEKYNKPGNVFLGLVHRLDRQVSGVVLFAKNSKSASRLSAQFRERTVRKVYLAVVGGGTSENLPADSPVFESAAGHFTFDDGHPRLAGGTTAGTREAILEYARIAHAGGRSLLMVLLHTGRKHQIRIQLSDLGMPIVGDGLYGSPERTGDDSLLLHAYALAFAHPTTRAWTVVTAPLPARFRAFFPLDDIVSGNIARLIQEVTRTPA